jgi:hypothetical protein
LTNAVIRALLAPAAVAAAIALAGCNADGIVPAGRAQAPLSEKTVALIESKNMDKARRSPSARGFLHHHAGADES